MLRSYVPIRDGDHPLSDGLSTCFLYLSDKRILGHGEPYVSGQCKILNCLIPSLLLQRYQWLPHPNSSSYDFKNRRFAENGKRRRKNIFINLFTSAGSSIRYLNTQFCRRCQCYNLKSSFTRWMLYSTRTILIMNERIF